MPCSACAVDEPGFWRRTNAIHAELLSVKDRAPNPVASKARAHASPVASCHAREMSSHCRRHVPSAATPPNCRAREGGERGHLFSGLNTARDPENLRKRAKKATG